MDDYIKVNFDATFDKRMFKSCSGIVTKNSKGQVIVSHSVVQKNLGLAFVSEALACLEAVQLGLDLKFTKVIVEGDLLFVI